MFNLILKDKMQHWRKLLKFECINMFREALGFPPVDKLILEPYKMSIYIKTLYLWIMRV